MPDLKVSNYENSQGTEQVVEQSEQVKNDTKEQIVDIPDFLIALELPDEAKNTITEFLDKNEKGKEIKIAINECINMGLSPQYVYELIKEDLLIRYTESIKEGGYLSEYFANEIIRGKDETKINGVLENLKNTQEYDDERKIISILEKLRNFYENYIGVKQENEPDCIRYLDTGKLNEALYTRREVVDVEEKLLDILGIKYILSGKESNMDEYRKGYEEIIWGGLNKNLKYLEELTILEERETIDKNQEKNEEVKDRKRVLYTHLNSILNSISKYIRFPRGNVELKFSEKLFSKLKKFKYYYSLLIENNDKFDIDKKTRIDFFNTLLGGDYKNGYEDQKDLLKRIRLNIDHFKGLDDKQYID